MRVGRNFTEDYRHQQYDARAWSVLRLVLTFVGIAIVTMLALPKTGYAADDLIDIPISKYWDDNGNRAGLRPQSVTLHLYDERNPNTAVQTITLDNSVTETNDIWVGTFTGVPKKDPETGDDITYIVKEDVPSNYLASYDYGYDGYRIVFDGFPVLPDDDGLSIRIQAPDGKWYGGNLSELSTRFNLSWTRTEKGGVQLDTTELELTLRAFAEDILNSNGDSEGMMWNWTSGGYTIQHIVELKGDECPDIMENYPIGYNVLWEYRANLGKNVPVMRILVRSESWGWHDNKVKIKAIIPVRNPDKAITITDTLNLRDYPFDKIWDDEGLTEHRPDSVTVDLFQNNSSDPYKTLTLHADSQPAGNTWHGTFTGLPIYDEGFHEYEYSIKERPVSGYSTTYDSEYYNGVDVTFTDDTFLDVQNTGVYNDQGQLMSIPWLGVNGLHSYDDTVYSTLTGITHSFLNGEFYIAGVQNPTRQGNLAAEFTSRIGIASVKRVHCEPFSGSTIPETENEALMAKYGFLSNGGAYHELVPGAGNIEFATTTNNSISRMNYVYFHYKWDDSQTFAGADIIVNHTNYREITFKKIWDDAEDASMRPQSATYDLYDADGNLIKTVTLNKDDAGVVDSSDDSIWHGTFGEYLVKEDDGTLRPYTIKEHPIVGYYPLYDSDDPQASALTMTFSADSDFDNINMSGISDFRSSERGIFRYYAGGVSAGDFVSLFTRNGDGTYKSSYVGSRALLYLADSTNFELISVNHEAVDRDEFMRIAFDATHSSQTLQQVLNSNILSSTSQYGLIYASSAPMSWTRTDDTSNYFLYEQTDPFAYDNIIRNRRSHEQPSKKVDENGNLLAGATMQIIRINPDGSEGDVIDEWISDDNEELTPHKTYVAPGEYVLREAAAPKGYKKAADTRFSINPFFSTVPGEDGTQSKKLNEDGLYEILTVTNYPKTPTKVSISKVEITGGEELPGAKLRITDEEGTIIDEWISTKKPHIIEDVLEAGATYTLHEDGAPAGHAYASEITFKVNDDGSVTKVEMVDEPTQVSISKREITGGPEIPGAVLQVFDSNNELIDSWISTDTPHLIKGILNAGETYRLHEESAPYGYAYASDIMFVVNKDSTVTHVEMIDEALPNTPRRNSIKSLAQTGDMIIGTVILADVLATFAVIALWKRHRKA